MSPERLLIRQVQDLDLRIGELTAEIRSLPKYVREIEAKLASHKSQLEAEKAALEENVKQRRRFESEIVDFDQKKSRLQDQLNEARTNEQFRAFQHEIEFARNAVGKLEDRILDKMEEAEALDKNVSKAEAELTIESTKVASEVEHAHAKVAGDEEELARSEKQRSALAARLPSPVLAVYERARRRPGSLGVAVAEVVGERCKGCNMMLRPHFLQQLRSSADVLTCEFCGRILFYEGEAENAVAVEDPAGESGAGVT